MAEGAIRVDGNLYFPKPMYIELPEFIKRTSPQNRGSAEGLFGIPKGLKTPIVHIFNDKSFKDEDQLGTRYFSLEHLKLARPPVTWNGKQLVVKEPGASVAQNVTPALKPVYTLERLKQMAKTYFYIFNAPQRLFDNRRVYEAELSKYASSYSYTSILGIGTSEPFLQYAVIPKGNNGVILIVRIPEGSIDRWKACSKILPESLIAYKTGSMNELPYFLLSSPMGNGGQIARYVGGASFLKTDFKKMPACDLL